MSHKKPRSNVDGHAPKPEAAEQSPEQGKDVQGKKKHGDAGKHKK